jgi:hypothetical protein
MTEWKAGDRSMTAAGAIFDAEVTNVLSAILTAARGNTLAAAAMCEAALAAIICREVPRCLDSKAIEGVSINILKLINGIRNEIDAAKEKKS